MASPVKKLIRGRAPTLLDTERANEVIGLLNALANCKVSPDGMGSVHVGSDEMTIDLGGIAQQLSKIHGSLQSISIALSNPNFSIVCNGNGTITATLTFPTVTI